MKNTFKCQIDNDDQLIVDPSRLSEGNVWLAIQTPDRTNGLDLTPKQAMRLCVLLVSMLQKDSFNG